VQALSIDTINLKEPILDIGCGIEHHLVTYLQEMGYDAYGIDRDTRPGEKIFKESWLDYDFNPSYWGTVISHLSFTNHFRHHHLKTGSDHLLYAKKYIQILQSLKPGGRFYYAPGLPFIEVFLNPTHYSIAKGQVAHTSFYSVCAERVS
jgi:SAM-dependent methyltransferase